MNNRGGNGGKARDGFTSRFSLHFSPFRPHYKTKEAVKEPHFQSDRPLFNSTKFHKFGARFLPLCPFAPLQDSSVRFLFFLQLCLFLRFCSLGFNGPQGNMRSFIYQRAPSFGSGSCRVTGLNRSAPKLALLNFLFFYTVSNCIFFC